MQLLLMQVGCWQVGMASNPSHLEAVSPVVLGLVAAEQSRVSDTDPRKSVAGILIHGDAAFAGLGIVSETLQLASIPGGPQQQIDGCAVRSHALLGCNGRLLRIV